MKVPFCEKNCFLKNKKMASPKTPNSRKPPNYWAMGMIVATVFVALVIWQIVQKSRSRAGIAPPFNKIVTFTGGKENKYCGVDWTNQIVCNFPAHTDNSTTFILENTGDGRVAFKSGKTAQYCKDQADRIVCDTDEMIEHTRYHWKDQGGQKFQLTGPVSGKKRRYCADEGNRIRCNREKAGPWENFTLQSQDDDPSTTAAATSTTTAATSTTTASGTNATVPGTTPPPKYVSSSDAVIDSITIAQSTKPPPRGKAMAFVGGRGGKYCAVDDAMNIQCNEVKPTDRALFEAEHVQGNVYALKNVHTGKYCHDQGTRIVCDKDHVLGHEQFHWISRPDNKFSLTGPKSGKKRHYCTDQGSTISCGQGTPGFAENFKIITIQDVSSEKEEEPEASVVDENWDDYQKEKREADDEEGDLAVMDATSSQNADGEKPWSLWEWILEFFM